MTARRAKPVLPRELANRDVDEAIAHYLSEGAPHAALGFIDALERAYAHIGRHPATGSSRYAHELNLPGLRFWPLPRHPHLVFYIERDDHIDVWRVLHGQRDLPAWMHGNALHESSETRKHGRPFPRDLKKKKKKSSVLP